jgi:hypothetical protein
MSTAVVDNFFIAFLLRRLVQPPAARQRMLRGEVEGAR